MVLFEIHQKFKGHFLNELRASFNGVVDILRTVGKRPIKVFHMSTLLELYPNFEFYNNDGDVSVDAVGDASIQSSY